MTVFARAFDCNELPASEFSTIGTGGIEVLDHKVVKMGRCEGLGSLRLPSNVKNLTQRLCSITVLSEVLRQGDGIWNGFPRVSVHRAQSMWNANPA